MGNQLLKNTVRVWFVLCVGAWLMPVTANAVIIAHEDFTGYTAGTLVGKGTSPSYGFSDSWTAVNGSGTANVDTTAGLTYTDYIGGGGAAVRVTPGGALDIGRTLTTGQNSGTTYYAFLAKYEAAGPTSSAVTNHFRSTGPVTVTAFGNYGTFGSSADLMLTYSVSGFALAGHPSPVPYAGIALNSTRLIVFAIEWNQNGVNDRVSVYLNPNLAAGQTANNATTRYDYFNDRNLVNLSRLFVSGYGTGSVGVYDGLVVATQWTDLIVPEPGTLSMMFFGAVFVWCFRRNRS